MKALPVRTILALTALIALLSTCVSLTGCSESQRQRTIKASVTATNAARDGFIEWDRQHQLKIVEQATTREEAIAKLGAYRAARSFVVSLFEAVYRSLAIAATQTDEKSLQDAMKEVKLLIKAIEALKGDVRWQTGLIKPSSSSKLTPRPYTASRSSEGSYETPCLIRIVMRMPCSR